MNLPDWFVDPPKDPGYLFAAANATSSNLRVAISSAEQRGRGTIALVDAKGNLLTTWGNIKTALLPNYPNPFNPETWIPYLLAETTAVNIQIYDINGRPVRTLRLGQKPAGEYIQKGEAAYWDGKDNAGEPVASGVYFCTLKAGNFAATRKMLLVK